MVAGMACAKIGGYSAPWVAQCLCSNGSNASASSPVDMTVVGADRNHLKVPVGIWYLRLFIVRIGRVSCRMVYRLFKFPAVGVQVLAGRG